MKLALSFSFWSSSYFKLNECCRQRISFRHHGHKLPGKVEGAGGGRVTGTRAPETLKDTIHP